MSTKELKEQAAGEEKKQWFVIHAYSGFENKVKKLLEEKIKLTEMEKYFGDIMVPTEEVVEMKSGKKRRSERKFFPSYVLVKMVMNDDTWHLVNSIDKVMGFIGGTKGSHPSPITEKEANAILQKMEDSSDKPKPKILFEAGEVVRVTEGPFEDFNAVVEEVNYEKNRLSVAVSIFGRSTPVELEFSQVEKT